MNEMNVENETPVAAPPPLPPRKTRTMRPRPWLVRLVAEHNPFYLLSAACMLASCLALTNTVTWNPIATRRLLTLIVTLNLYEAALLGIALFLMTSGRRNLRDGRVLLLLQAFFLADFTFLNAEIATSSGAFSTGLIVNAVLFVLAAVKLGLVLGMLRPTFTLMQYGFVLLQLGILFATPSIFRWVNIHRHAIGPRDFYALWWVTALLPAVYEVVSRFDVWRAKPLSVAARAQAAPTTTYLWLPYVSLLTHFGILHYVYDTGFYAAHAAPVLLGLTLILNRVNPTTLMPRRDLMILRFLLPLAAVMVSMGRLFALPLHATYPVVTLTPLNLAIDGAFLTYVWCFLRPNARLFVATWMVAKSMYILGPTTQQMAHWADSGWEWTATSTDRMMPKTVADWGLLGLVGSFAFLAIGFWVSLSRRHGESLAPGEDSPPGDLA
jgi:hypothetical protein